MTGEIKDISSTNIVKNNNNSATKELYIVTVEDPTIKAKSRVHIATRVDMGPVAAVMVGYEIVDRTLVEEIANSKTVSYNDAVDRLKSSGQDFEVITIPWNKVIRIKTVKYNISK